MYIVYCTYYHIISAYNDMTYKKQKGINPIGSVICFVVYVILCGQIITLIESQWLIVPAGLQAIVNRQNVDGQTIKVFICLVCNKRFKV